MLLRERGFLRWWLEERPNGHKLDRSFKYEASDTNIKARLSEVCRRVQRKLKARQGDTVPGDLQLWLIDESRNLQGAVQLWEHGGRRLPPDCKLRIKK